MSYKWPDLDPNELDAYSVDWSRFLNESDTIASVAWYIDDTLVASYGVQNGLQMIQPTNTTTVATARFTGGVNGTRYNITCRITTVDGLIHERDIYLKVREQ
jgi:hypothetical protein